MAFRRHAFGHDRFAGASIIGTIGAFVGMIAAVWMNSLRKRLPVEWRRHRSSFPGSKDGNWIFGTIFGCYRHMEIQWLMSLGPFPLVQRLTGQTSIGAHHGALTTLLILDLPK